MGLNGDLLGSETKKILVSKTILKRYYLEVRRCCFDHSSIVESVQF